MVTLLGNTRLEMDIFKWQGKKMSQGDGGPRATSEEVKIWVADQWIRLQPEILEDTTETTK